MGSFFLTRGIDLYLFTGNTCTRESRGHQTGLFGQVVGTVSMAGLLGLWEDTCCKTEEQKCPHTFTNPVQWCYI